MIFWTAFVILTFGWHSQKLPDAQTIIQRSVEANKSDWNASPKYEFDETDYLPGGHSRTYHVTMILGSPYERLIDIDGKPLSAQQNQAEEQKLQEAIAARGAETREEHVKRVESYQKDRARAHLLMDQLAVAFDFRVIGEKKLGPYQVYILKATRRSGYDPPNREAEVLTGMEGKLWIDEKTFQWVKVEAHVIRPVSIEGFLARVEPGTQFELQKMPVGNGLWLRKHFSMRARAKVLLLFSHNEQQAETYSNYRLQSTNHNAQIH